MNAKFKPNQKVKYIRTVNVDKGFFTTNNVYIVSSIETWTCPFEKTEVVWLNFDKDDRNEPNGHSSKFFEPVGAWTVGYINEKK